MKKIRILTIAASMICAFSLHAAPITIKVASVAPARSSWDIKQKQIAKDWATITNGEVILQFMTSDAMGGESGVVKKLNSIRPGQKAPIGGAIFTSMGLSDFVPESNVMTLCAPCLFRNQDEVNAVLKEFTPEMQAAFDAKGYKVLGWFNIGWAYWFTSKPATKPEELKKLRLAVGGLTSPALSNAFKSAGYLTQDVPNDKLMQSLSSGEVEGLFTIPMYSYAAQYYKSLKYALEMPLCPVMVSFIMNKKDWDSIPDKYKPALLESIKKAENEFIADQKKSDAEYLARCRDGGCTIITPTQDQIKAWETSFGSDLHYMYEGKNPVVDKALYEKINAFLKTFRGE